MLKSNTLVCCEKLKSSLMWRRGEERREMVEGKTDERRIVKFNVEERDG